VIPDLLTRRRNTPPQGRLGPAARRRNVAGAFVVTPARRSALRGRRVLLVDDVMTTGATISACSRALLRAGAAAVDVLVLTRVVRPGYGN
jgi:predicted amidophosphoribosyltransferase